MKKRLVWSRRIASFWSARHGKWAAMLFICAWCGLIAVQSLQPFKRFRYELFDVYQMLLPRQSSANQVAIVEIDEATLQALGQWPWPRNYLAALIDAIQAYQPRVIGLDILFPESDHASPQTVAESRPDLPPEVIESLKQAASNDQLLAHSFSQAPVVLGLAGLEGYTSLSQSAVRLQPVILQGEGSLSALRYFPYALASIPPLQQASRGQGLLSSELDHGIFRRNIMLAHLQQALVPNLSLELLRIATGSAALVVTPWWGGHGVRSVQVGPYHIPLQYDAEAWVYFDRLNHQRYISALNVLKQAVPPAALKNKIVLVGLTGLGLQDVVVTPMRDRRPGVEAHAQFIESVLEKQTLYRPWWLVPVELCWLMLLGAACIHWFNPAEVPVQYAPERRKTQSTQTYAGKERRQAPTMQIRYLTPGRLFQVFMLLLFIHGLFGLALFAAFGLLFDIANVLLALLSVLISLAVSSNVLEARALKQSEHALLVQKIQAAKINGEMEAASKIQLGTLPIPAQTFPRDEQRFAIAAFLQPVRHVGGDLYDFFMVDADTLFFVIGDVSGKGMPASLLMVVTKALMKNAVLRSRQTIQSVVNTVNTEMSRENPQMLFVTGLAGMLSLNSGELQLVNAGHDAPWLLKQDGTLQRLESGGNPPLGVMDEFEFSDCTFQLQAGDTLVMVTDGVTEAMDASGAFYTVEQVTASLSQVAPAASAEQVLQHLKQALFAFVGEAEQADDITIISVAWHGPQAKNKQPDES